MQKKHPVHDIVEPIINDLGFEIVRISTIGNVNPTLQIMIERKDRKNLVVEDCAKVSRAISDILDEKDPIKGKYSLEVSSPGVDRPLVTPEHFKRFCNYETKLETSVEVDGRKRFKGKISKVDEENNIYFVMDEKEYLIPFDAVAKAKLVLTDELFEEYMKAQEEIEL